MTHLQVNPHIVIAVLVAALIILIVVGSAWLERVSNPLKDFDASFVGRIHATPNARITRQAHHRRVEELAKLNGQLSPAIAALDASYGAAATGLSNLAPTDFDLRAYALGWWAASKGVDHLQLDLILRG